MSLCNATKQELISAGLNVLSHCTVDGCGLPVARHRDEQITGQICVILYEWNNSLDEFLKSIFVCSFMCISICSYNF